MEDGLKGQHRHELLLIRSLITIGFISRGFLTMTTVVFISMTMVFLISDPNESKVPSGAPCFRIGGAEDSFIFYIEYCLFFAPVKELKRDYILKQF